MREEPVSRVHYFDRQFLRTQDFRDEQRYHLDRSRRHRIGQHLWGIVSGLELTVGDGTEPAVLPGLAVDGFGRDLVVAARRPLPAGAFDDKGSEELAVWLVYDRLPGEETPAGYGGCGEDGGESGFYRWVERPQVRLEPPDPAFPDPRRPRSVAEADLDSDPSRTPPDEVARDWPVYLGLLRRDRSDPQSPTYAVDLVGRPYAGLVGAAVRSPWDEGTAMELGGDHGDGPPAFKLTLGGGTGPALSLAADGRLEIGGPLDLDGDLDLDGALEFTSALEGGAGSSRGAEGGETAEGRARAAGEAEEAREEAAQDVRGPQPWRIYRADSEKGFQELRLEMAPGTGRVVIGAWSAEDNAFRPALTVAADGTVTVHGDLIVTGATDLGGGMTDRRLNAEAERLVLTSFTSGVAGSHVLLEEGPPAGEGRTVEGSPRTPKGPQGGGSAPAGGSGSPGGSLASRVAEALARLRPGRAEGGG